MFKLVIRTLPVTPTISSGLIIPYLFEFPDKTNIAYGVSAPVSPVAGTIFDLGGYNCKQGDFYFKPV